MTSAGKVTAAKVITKRLWVGELESLGPMERAKAEFLLFNCRVLFKVSFLLESQFLP